MIIYRIINTLNNKCYIGKTTYSLSVRKSNHISDAKKGSNQYIHKAIRKYGEEHFTFEVLDDSCETETELNEHEMFWIKFLHTKAPDGYNLTEGGEGARGLIHSEERRQRNREVNLGKVMPEEVKEKIRQANIGRTFSEEWRSKISEANRRRGCLSQETKDKISKSKKGKKQSEEEKHMRSISRKTYLASLTEEERKNLGKSLRGRPSWNKGLTKETSESVKKISDKAKVRPRKKKQQMLVISNDQIS
jgi:group I intron endonuclease